MDECGEWWWFPLEPYIASDEWALWGEDNYREAIHISVMFYIAPVADWTKSLIKVG